MSPVRTDQPVKTRFRTRFRRELLSYFRFAMPSQASLPDASLRSVAELLRRRAAERPNQPAFVFLSDVGENAGSGEIAWTFAELDRRASAVAAAVRRHAEPGERAVLVFPPGLDFLAGFFGCLFAGVLPVPATYPKPRRASPRLDAIVEDCTPRLALTTAETLDLVDLDQQSARVRELPWFAVDECAEARFEIVDQNRDDTAFLQYTSGSTSQPRGVIVTHGNLLHNLEMIRQGFGMSPAASNEPPTAVFWLPAYHDMGLIGGMLSPLYVGGTSYLIAPASFLQRPMVWLETISRTRAAISGAPNFAYELCTRKTTPEQRASLDLSSWRLAFCGAEPIDARALQEFGSAMAAAGFREEAFYPCYGLAESTLMVTGAQGAEKLRVLKADRARLAARELVETPSANGEAPRLVSCGRPLGDQEVRIVDPQTFQPCRDGAIGEIWVRGHSVAAGYWNHPEELWQTFGGRLADGSGPYLRTGDLGAMHDGELFVTGRAKDLIIIRGRNLYPQDVERTAQQSHAAVDLGAAFSVISDGHEELVAVHQVHREHRRDDLAPVIRAIRAAVVEEHEVDPLAIVLLRPGALPLTSSGKVQRSKARALFEAGQLEELARWNRPIECRTAGPATADDGERVSPPRPKFLDSVSSYSAEALAEEVQRWMLAWLAARVEEGVGELTPTAPFTELGLDSLTALELNVDFEKVLGVRLPPAAAWSYPTPTALSRYLAEMLLDAAANGAASGEGVDSWFAAMEADVRRR
jgi:acyl-CoA synthetase (AMP-forming)/AMP-acid ligase II/acyl carrier protein